MDTTSIITQVKRDEDDNSTADAAANGCTAVAVLNERAELRSGGSKKPRTRGLLSSFFCCFGSNTGQSRPFSRRHPPTALTPNHINQNTLEKGYEHDDCPESTLEEIQQEVYLLPSIRHQDMHKKCIVIDLDETLVHSSFKPVHNADFIVPVEIDGTIHQVYVLKRPYVDQFLQRMGQLFECILFTASLAKYADPVANLLDKYDTFRARLFRESCVLFKGNYVKDLSRLGRDLKKSLIIDNSPASYIFHPENAVPVQSWFDDQNDTELLDIIPFLERLSTAEDVMIALQNNRNLNNGTLSSGQSINDAHSIN